MVVKDKNVLVFGSGISGEAACALLLKEEAKVVLYDGNDKLNPEAIRAKIEGGDSESLEIVLGTLEGERKEELLDKLDRIQSCEHEQQNLVHSKTLDKQCKENGKHVLQHRHESVEADFGEGLRNQAENSHRRQLHNSHSHFHHNVVEL